MPNIINIIKQIPDVCGIDGCSTQQVIDAQNALDIVFPSEFVEYVREFGCIDFGATEWTGLNITGRLNTVNATNREKSVNPAFPERCFVLEDLGIDGKLIIVNEHGEVFLLQHETQTFLCNSISKYLEMCINKQSQ